MSESVSDPILALCKWIANNALCKVSTHLHLALEGELALLLEVVQEHGALLRVHLL